MFFFNDTATTEIYTLSLHDALPIYHARRRRARAGHVPGGARAVRLRGSPLVLRLHLARRAGPPRGEKLPLRPDGRSADRKSTRLNSSHANISYAVFCLKKNN